MGIQRIACALYAALLIAGAAGQAVAQSRGNFVLGAGFTPSPQTAQGLTGGIVQTIGFGIQASHFGPECVGTLGRAPSHRIKVTSALDLQLSIASTTDSTLVLVGPAGVFCDDDSAGNLDARIHARLIPGEYAVYVGHLDGSGDYELTLTEGANDAVASGGSPADFTFGAGFAPGLQVGSGSTGDRVLARAYGAHCNGIVALKPNHRMTITSAVTLRLALAGTGDASLVVRGPGKLLCDDDRDNPRNAAIVDTFQPGEYVIHIGDLGQAGEYQLSISETR